MQIRICTKQDLPQLLEVFKQSYLEHYTYLWYDNGENYIKTVLSPEKIGGELADPNSVFFLVHYKNKPVGLAKVNVNHERGGFSATEAMELERIYFLKEAAGQGLGKATIEYIADFARQKGKKLLWLKAMAESSSVVFYQKQGFTVEEETHLEYPLMKVELRKMYVMFKPL